MRNRRKLLQMLLTVNLVVSGSFGSASGYTISSSSPLKWGAPETGTYGGTVTYSFASEGQVVPDGIGSFHDLASYMPLGYKAAIEAAFGVWEAVANIHFVEVPGSDPASGSAAALAAIQFGGADLDGPGLEVAQFRRPSATSLAGSVYFDASETWKIGSDGPGIDVFQVAAHEIGHAIGLRHENSESALMDPNYTESFRGLQADDIAGAQYIYGAATGAPQIAQSGQFTISMSPSLSESMMLLSVPEPGSWVLLVTGLLAAVILRRRYPTGA